MPEKQRRSPVPNTNPDSPDNLAIVPKPEDYPLLARLRSRNPTWYFRFGNPTLEVTITTEELREALNTATTLNFVYHLELSQLNEFTNVLSTKRHLRTLFPWSHFSRSGDALVIPYAPLTKQEEVLRRTLPNFQIRIIPVPKRRI